MSEIYVSAFLGLFAGVVATALCADTPAPRWVSYVAGWLAMLAVFWWTGVL